MYINHDILVTMVTKQMYSVNSTFLGKFLEWKLANCITCTYQFTYLVIKQEIRNVYLARACQPCL